MAALSSAYDLDQVAETGSPEEEKVLMGTTNHWFVHPDLLLPNSAARVP